jgi:hypothetical protein
VPCDPRRTGDIRLTANLKFKGDIYKFK